MANPASFRRVSAAMALGTLLYWVGFADGWAQTVAPAAPAPAQAVASAGPATEDYKLDAGDKVRVIVFGEMDLGGEFEVDGNGFVRLPLIGQIRAVGLGLHEFENSVTAALEEGYLKNPKVSVEVINYRPFYILGQVKNPGEYPFVNGMNVLTAVARAGGYTYRARESNVYIRRKGSANEQEVPADQTTKVYPGDIVRVAERFF